MYCHSRLQALYLLHSPANWSLLSPVECSSSHKCSYEEAVTVGGAVFRPLHSRHPGRLREFPDRLVIRGSGPHTAHLGRAYALEVGRDQAPGSLQRSSTVTKKLWVHPTIFLAVATPDIKLEHSQKMGSEPV